MQELKHITAYLPYDVKCNVMGRRNEYGEDEVFDVIGVYDMNDVFISTVRSSDYMESDINDVFLLLIPLSNLDKELTHNGETFIPYKKLGWGNGTHVIPVISALKISYEETQKLLEWHFDVFELIPKKLAIEKYF